MLGLEHARFLCDRIYDVIDENQTNEVNFDDFIKYMHTLIDGSVKQKAEQSFRMLDINRNGQLSFQDIAQVVQETSLLWNYLTGSRGNILFTSFHLLNYPKLNLQRTT